MTNMVPSVFGLVLLFVFFSCNCGGGSAAKRLKNVTTCEEFERRAIFSPTEIVDSLWIIFYFWAYNAELHPVGFSLPANKSVGRIKEVVDAVRPNLDVPWNTARFIMQPRAGLQVLMLDGWSAGAYRALVVQDPATVERPKSSPHIDMADVRFKQIGRYIGMMACEEMTAYALVRKKEAPKTDQECEEAAALFNYRGLPGRCYLEIHRERKKKQEL